MTEPISCCRELARVPGGAGSPFTRIIALDWYDGPRSGLLQCEVCGREFRFELLDERLDEGDGPDLRVYSLAPLPAGSIAKVVAALAGTHPPAWPVWAPIWTFPDPEAKAAAEASVDRVIEQAARPELVVVTRDLAAEIREARAITDDDVATVDDWVSFLANSPARFET